MPNRRSAQNGMLAIITIVLVMAGLRATYSVTMPLAAAIVLISAVWPIKPWLDRGLPSPLSYLITALVLLAILLGFVAAVYFSAAQVVHAFAQNWDKLKDIYQTVDQWLGKRGISLGDQGGYDRLIRVGQEVLANAYTILIYLGFIAILIVLGLPEVGALKRKIIRDYDSDSVREITTAVAEIADKIRLYLGVTTLTSIITGVACGLWTLAWGLDLALVWGTLNFLLNYIPVVGNLLGIIPPSLYALMQFQTWPTPVAIFVGLGVIQIIISNFVYPMLQGRSLSLSPIAIVIAVALWSWMWGVAGALVAVPLTAVAASICEHFDATRWLASLVSAPRAVVRRNVPRRDR